MLSASWIWVLNICKQCTAPAAVTVGRGAVTMKVMLIPGVTQVRRVKTTKCKVIKTYLLNPPRHGQPSPASPAQPSQPMMSGDLSELDLFHFVSSQTSSELNKICPGDTSTRHALENYFTFYKCELTFSSTYYYILYLMTMSLLSNSDGQYPLLVTCDIIGSMKGEYLIRCRVVWHFTLTILSE